MNKLGRKLYKIFSLVSGLSLVFNSILPVGVLPLIFATPAYAQTITPTDTTTPTVAPTDTTTPTPTDTIAPTDTTTPTPTLNPTDTATPTPTGDILDGVSTESATPTETLAPTDTTTPADTTTPTNIPDQSNNSTPTPAPMSTATPTPTVVPTPTPEANGHVEAAILKNANALSLNLSGTDVVGSAVLTTNKPDYAPTDTVVISGTGFIPNRPYKLFISSTDPPPVNFETEIKTDSSGDFIYSYQLDGNYRPNYTVTVKDGNTVVATTSFLDSVTPTPATGGSAISSATVGGSYTSLTGPTITEGANGDVGTGTIVFNAPSGFIFNIGQNVTATITRDNGNKNCFAIPVNVVTPTTGTITFTVTAADQSTGGGTTTCHVTFSNIQVRPTAVTPLSSGNITNSGTASINGTNGSTNYGTLTEVSSSGPILDVAGAGTGNGTVTSNDGHFNCTSTAGTTSGTCTYTYSSDNPSVTLTAAAAIGSSFSGWSGGGCSGTGTCAPTGLTGTSTVTITATFDTSGSGSFGPTSAQNIACMANQPTAPPNLTCTANDIQIASVSNINIVAKSYDGGATFTPASGQNCDYPGQFIKFTAAWHVQSTATSRYNVGLWFANQGQSSALSGTCSASTLPGSPSPFFEATDDTCGDIHSGSTGTVTPDITVIAQCIAAPGTNQLNLPYCTSWNQNESAGNNCSGPVGTVAGAPSKCNCQNSNPIPITVPPAIKVNKILSPTNDPGLFNLLVNGKTSSSSANVGNGGTTGEVTVASGSNTVGESAGTSTSLSNYASTISCVDQNSNPVSVSGNNPSWTIMAADGQNITCTITNTRNQVTPSVTTQVQNATNTDITNTTVPVGTVIHDHATVDSGLASMTIPTGSTFTFHRYSTIDCTGTPTDQTGVSVPSGAQTGSANSDTFTPGAGSYSYKVDFVSGNTASVTNATGVCEPITVSKLSPSISTTLSATSSSIGVNIHDSATLSGATSTAGGTVTYHAYAGANTCTGTDLLNSTKTVTGGVVPNSDNISFANAGTYSFQAMYSGDGNNNGATSTCSTEQIVVGKNSPSVSTKLSASSVDVGTAVHDSATLSGATSGAGGTATYTVYSDNACTQNGQSAGTKTVSGGVIPDSDPITFNTAGNYYWQVVYSGDSNNNSATSTCTDEHLVVNKVTPSLSTEIHNASEAAVTTVPAGTSVHDKATITGGFNPSGNVQFTFYPNNSCTKDTGTVAGTVVLSGGVAHPSSTEGPLNAGAYSFSAHYVGDTNNNPADSACEPLTVTQLTPNVSTIIHLPTGAAVSGPIVLGSSVSDEADVTGSFGVPTGNVDFTFYPNGTCSPTGSTAGNVSLNGSGVASPSDTEGPLSTGSYSFRAHYNGDTNYSAEYSECETLSVNKGSLSLATTIHNSSDSSVISGPVTLGTSVYDSASASGIATGVSPTNPVTFTFFTNGSCDGTGTSAGSIALSGNTASPSTTEGPLTAGSYSFHASIADDANYTGGTSACEPLTVTKSDTRVSTQVHDPSHTDITNSSVSLGTAVHDSASVVGQIGKISPTGTVTYNLYGNNSCTGDPIISPETVSVGTESTPQTLGAGNYGYIAGYSGDSNYNSSAGTCEPFTINKAQLHVTTNIHDPQHTIVTSVDLGSVVHDQATVSGTVQGFTAPDVTFRFYNNLSCGGDGSPSTNTGDDPTGGVRSADTAALGAGSYSYKASIAGNSNYVGDASDCEPLTVNQGTPTVTTEVHDSNHNVIGSETLDFNVHDLATVSGNINGFAPTGTVDFSFYAGSACDTKGTSAGTVTIDQNGIAHPSNTENLTSAGLYSFKAHYNGDTNYPATDSACEPFTLTTLQINKTAQGGDGTFTYNYDGPLSSTTSATTSGGSGQSELIPILAGTYDVTEDPLAGWTQGSAYCGNEVNPNQYAISAGTAGACYFTNQKNGTVKVIKFNDANDNQTYDTNEVTMNGWDMLLDNTKQTTAVDGSTTFTDVVPGTHQLQENLQNGWEQTVIYCSSDNTETLKSSAPTLAKSVFGIPQVYAQAIAGHTVNVNPGQDVTCYVGNHSLAPILTITKENNTGGANQSQGGNVLFTLTVTNDATAGASLNTTVTDLPAGGFTYRSGSWTANSSVRGDIKNNPTTEPSYHSPGVWQLGTLQPGETVTLTYIADIAGDEQPGLYNDLAWAQGQDAAADNIIAMAQNPGYVADNYVGTQVKIATTYQAGANVNVVGQVLGASTELPATGANQLWTYIAFLLIGGGLTIGAVGWYLRRKYA